MAWERRGNRDYFYTAERVDGRVVKSYIGAGRTADLAAQLVARDRRDRAAERAAIEAERKALAAVDAELDRLDELTDLLAEAAILAAGYHRHHRGEWRKRRGDATATSALG